jgi:5'-3' exonuclease
MAKVLVDGNYFITRACYAPNIERDHDPTAQFLRNLWDVKDLGDLVVVFDGRRPQFRLDLYPDYKKKPQKAMTEEEAAEAEHVAWLRATNRRASVELLTLAGIPAITHPDYEADDQIYRLAQHFSKFEEVYCVTSDSDYFQMCRFGARIVRPYHNETVDRLGFFEQYGFDVDYYPLFLSMTGTHNSVPGIHGIGPVRATEIVKQLTSPDLEGLRLWTTQAKGKIRDLVKENLKVVKRNMVLVDLERVPLTGYEMYALWEETKAVARLNYKEFMLKAKELQVGNAARWVPYLLGKKGKK